jgi:hypothetical protein
MATIKQLRDELMDTFNKLRSGEIEVKVAAEMNNTAGKVINTIKAELEYAVIRGDVPVIAFMHEPVVATPNEEETEAAE